MSRSSLPPGPSPWRLLVDFIRGRQKSLPHLMMMRRRYGDVISLPLNPPKFILYDPSDVKHVLVTNPSNYLKTGGLLRGRALFGDGLLSSDGATHAGNKRLIQPAFHKASIMHMTGIMTETIMEKLSGWGDGRVIDASAEMKNITLRIVGRALFSTDFSPYLQELGDGVNLSQRYITDRIWTPIRFPPWKWKRRFEEYQSAIAQLDRIVYDMIDARRKSESKPDDLLTILTEGRYEDGTCMTDRQARDEIATFIAAGHETTSNALTWTWYLLSQNPRVEDELLRELRAHLGGRVPVASDIPNLRYTEMVIAEAMRLYPPVWLMARRAVEEDILPGGTCIPAGSEIILIPYVSHRTPEYFPDPDSFKPERFSERSRRDLQFIYFPFSAGSRGCIGEPFARTEAILLLATVAQRWKLILEPGGEVEPEFLQTLQPKNGLPMRIQRRL